MFVVRLFGVQFVLRRRGVEARVGQVASAHVERAGVVVVLRHDGRLRRTGGLLYELGAFAVEVADGGPQALVLPLEGGQAVGQAHEAVLVAFVVGLQPGVPFLQLAASLQPPGGQRAGLVALPPIRVAPRLHLVQLLAQVHENVFHHLVCFVFERRLNLPIAPFRFG